MDNLNYDKLELQEYLKLGKVDAVRAKNNFQIYNKDGNFWRE